MRFLWFWAFWHWSQESFQEGAFLNEPLEEIGSHWDEWFLREASVVEREAIERTEKSPAERRAFLLWLIRRWSRNTDFAGNRQATRFVLHQLAARKPFVAWEEFDPYRTTYRSPGVQAVILAENSLGEKADVREMEATLLPMQKAGGSAPVIAEGFRADRADLLAPWEAAQTLFGGKMQTLFLLRWMAWGARPYSTAVRVILTAGWVAVAALIVYLLYGPEPGSRLESECALLLGLWAGLVVTGLTVAGVQGFAFWRQSREWSRRLRRGQLRLRLNGKMILKGGSAGLAFCLNALLATYRAYPEPAKHSWLWRRFYRALRGNVTRWAATGIVTSDGRINPVALTAKLRACERHGKLSHFLVPRQRSAGFWRGAREGEEAESGTATARESSPAMAKDANGLAVAPTPTYGFAAEMSALRIHPCRDLAHAAMHVGGFASRWQATLNGFALFVSVVMIAALPDLRGILRPPAAPAVVLPTSPSPYYLWVSLDTTQPEDFQVALESRFWANRRVNVARHDGPLASTRAEIGLLRLATPTAVAIEEGTVWIERRRKFLRREYDPGERVGRFSYSYVAHLHE